MNRSDISVKLESRREKVAQIPTGYNEQQTLANMSSSTLRSFNLVLKIRLEFYEIILVGIYVGTRSRYR